MFARSAAADTQQGRAIQRVNERFGSDALGREGRESLGMAVCKKKYTPFVFPMTTTTTTNATATGSGGSVQVTAERRFGCRAHHALRVSVIAQHGLRPGWEPFGQWTYKKANELARKDTMKRNRKAAAVEDGTTTTEDELSLSSAEGEATCVNLNTTSSSSSSSSSSPYAANNFRSLCWNGNCLVKDPSMYDDVEEECRQLVNHDKSTGVSSASTEAKRTRQEGTSTAAATNTTTTTTTTNTAKRVTQGKRKKR